MKIRYLIGILLGIILFVIFLRGVHFEQLYTAIKSAKISLILFGLSLNFITYYLRAVRWKIILEPVKQVTCSDCFKITAIGFMINNLVPRTGDVVRPWLLSRHEKISLSACFATIFMERVFDFLFLLIILGILFLTITSGGMILDESMYSYIIDAGIILVIIILGIIGFMICLVFQKNTVLRFINYLSKYLPVNLVKKVEGIIDQFGVGLEIVKNVKKTMLISIISLLMWQLLVFQILLTLYAFDSEILKTADFFKEIWMCNFILIISALSLIIPSPGGVGSFHLIFAKTLGFFGETAVLAKSIALVIHFTSMVPIMFMGLYFLYTGNYISIKKVLSKKDNLNHEFNEKNASQASEKVNKNSGVRSQESE